MRRSVQNNCRTKIFFNPSGSEDIPKITGMLRGISREELTGIGKYRAVIQTPGEGSYSNATFFNTYPPYPGKLEQEELEKVKRNATNPREPRETRIERSIGDTAASGGETHAELLKEAKQHLEFAEDVQVNPLHQDGNSKPDAHIISENGVAHLEAEHSTLSKPEKVLANLERARTQDRECVFVVKEDRLDRLQSILEEEDNDDYRVLISTNLGVIEP